MTNRTEQQPAPLLSLNHISLEYQTSQHRVRAVHDVSFEVYPADRFVLLGPSGCGKSSLLKAIGGFIPPTSGEILLEGKKITAPGPERMTVFQEFDQLAPWKTVISNVMFPLLVSGKYHKKQAREIAGHYLHKVGLSRFTDVYPHMLSGGMKQRVAIARAMAMKPEILLMDEPFASLDALTRRQMQEELLELWEDAGSTLLFVTHSIEEALLIGSRILILSAHPGQIRAERNCHQFTLHNQGNEEFRQAAREIHSLLFPEKATVYPSDRESPYGTTALPSARLSA
ncbi:MULTISPECIES: ABC transporter ATP-binding protein [Tatumella]|uniref:ABC transporter ATP-binding protein n=1 Tax=Tatumella punctata TaxID=399969 RepID=A0ABW1VKI2_9GAMM|nr:MULTISPECIES: ABC transporter ATP-binding protein [unclassified Tatumella]MBS0857603.1 ABC transporter ATP-binding protein [Tatumella sp. JGM16]MBS0876540.1 ABC transporter ATP-binding protein [Tatumella sp. JGM82]MBS0890073.1 ABC transporter ATP-binding protein [Tatumella sp. JGM94]MBS0895038.1 ABC transporter ATP-binding protein [Tatumella sp. JGM130]MBS0901317.1 ABC transporter ATP-binding protein [Tatumella sp. JGM100]